MTTCSAIIKAGRLSSNSKSTTPAPKKPEVLSKPKPVEKKPANNDDFGDILDDDVSFSKASSSEGTISLTKRNLHWPQSQLLYPRKMICSTIS